MSFGVRRILDTTGGVLSIVVVFDNEMISPVASISRSTLHSIVWLITNGPDNVSVVSVTELPSTFQEWISFPRWLHSVCSLSLPVQN